MSNPRDRARLLIAVEGGRALRPASGSAGCCIAADADLAASAHEAKKTTTSVTFSATQTPASQSHTVIVLTSFLVRLRSTGRSAIRPLPGTCSKDDDRNGGLFGATQAHGGTDTPIATQPSMRRFAARRRHPTRELNGSTDQTVACQASAG